MEQAASLPKMRLAIWRVQEHSVCAYAGRTRCWRAGLESWRARGAGVAMHGKIGAAGSGHLSPLNTGTMNSSDLLLVPLSVKVSGLMAHPDTGSRAATRRPCPPHPHTRSRHAPVSESLLNSCSPSTPPFHAAQGPVTSRISGMTQSWQLCSPCLAARHTPSHTYTRPRTILAHKDAHNNAQPVSLGISGHEK